MKFYYTVDMENMTEKEIFEALNNLRLEKIGERSIIGKIIASWTMKTTLNGS